jgi:phosphatidylserine decarboxylase
MEEIRIWNRATSREESEKVYGDRWVRWLYETSLGQGVTEGLLVKPWLSKLYGSYQASSASRHKVKPFIRDFAIPMEQYEDREFESFNDFFIRKFRPGARTFARDPNTMPAFAEARYLAWEKIEDGQTFPVKGSDLTAEAILGHSEASRPFHGGPLMIARLCPVDYHRYHYPDGGTTELAYPIRGKLHSVNPLALRYESKILRTNERYVSILSTKHFGKLAYVEVGALCVGKIVQTFPETQDFKRGAEKGYFLFGGSTVILLGEPGRWKPSADLLTNTAKKMETLIRLGDPVAHAAS